MKSLLKRSTAHSLEILCFDPQAAHRFKVNLAADLSGIDEPTWKGQEWTAKLFSDGQDGEFIAGFHDYCGSDAVNQNNAIWRLRPTESQISRALRKTKLCFENMNIRKVFYKTTNDQLRWRPVKKSS